MQTPGLSIVGDQSLEDTRRAVEEALARHGGTDYEVSLRPPDADDLTDSLEVYGFEPTFEGGVSIPKGSSDRPIYLAMIDLARAQPGWRILVDLDATQVLEAAAGRLRLDADQREFFAEVLQEADWTGDVEWVEGDWQ